jgi:hypothetical protein
MKYGCDARNAVMILTAASLRTAQAAIPSYYLTGSLLPQTATLNEAFFNSFLNQ